jgi:hypothetical protein
MESSRTPPSTLVWVVLIGVLGVVLFSTTPVAVFMWLWQKLSVFATVFLGIFIEAVPFLLLGTLASGLVEVFLDRELLMRFTSRSRLPPALTGAFMGLFFPVCECGAIPLTRRLFQKGLPLPAGVAFLLAAPVFNPIVILSTASAFGWGNMLVWRLGLTLIIAVVTGLVFSVEKDPWNILRKTPVDYHVHEYVSVTEIPTASIGTRLHKALVIGADEFIEMGYYLVFGAMLAAGMQTFIPQSTLLSIGSGPFLSVLVMQALAFILSICSTVDAFVALGFVGIFSFGSVLAFLTFGPMVDIKSLFMYKQVFKPRIVAYLVIFPFLMTLLTGLILNYLLV